MKIRTKLMAGFGIMVLFMGVIGYAGYQQRQRRSTGVGNDLHRSDAKYRFSDRS
jgi:CHASE3 domain sensor protein